MLLTISLIGIASCSLLPHAKVVIYDEEVCVDLSPNGAHCAHTLTAETRDLIQAEWDLVRVGRMSFTSEGFNDTETATDQICNELPVCDYQTRQAIHTAFQRMHPLIRMGDRAKKRNHK